MNKKAEAKSLAAGIILALVGIILWIFLNLALVGKIIFGIGLIFLFFGIFNKE
jgi:hypothetical protein